MRCFAGATDRSQINSVARKLMRSDDMDQAARRCFCKNYKDLAPERSAVLAA